MKKIFILLVLLSQSISAQNFKFGRVSLNQLEKKSYVLDTTANAIVLYTEISKDFDLENFQIIEHYVKRIKILNKEGFGYATKKIFLYDGKNDSEKFSDLKAYTYNFEHGKVTKIKLKKTNVYKNREDKDVRKVVFTMPDVKEGSIIEWKYTITTPYIMYSHFKIQQSIPVLKSKIVFDFPKIMGYAPLTKGYIHINLMKTNDNRNVTFNPRSMQTKYFEFNIYTAEIDNIPALKDEPYSGNINNYRLGVDFELKYYERPNYGVIKNFSTTWKEVIKHIAESNDFGRQLKKKSYLKNDIFTINQVDSIQKFKEVLALSKSSIKWDGEYGYLTKKGVVKAHKNGTGNVAEVNINLINLLKATGFNAYPILISTVSHGIPLLPSGKAFNYVIAGVKIGNKLILLDATNDNSIPNVLPERVLNFTGFLIGKNNEYKEINLFPNEYSVQKVQVDAEFNEDGFSGLVQKKLNKMLALKYRTHLREKRKDELKKWIDDYYDDIDVLKYRITNLDKLYKSTNEVIKFETESFFEDISGNIYINPLLHWQDKHPLFISERREFPIFFNYPKYDKTIVNITIPDNYEVESLPKSETIEMADKTVQWIYKITQNGKKITISALYLINTPIVTMDKYQELKKLYEKIIKKQTEKIVIKPKN